MRNITKAKYSADKSHVRFWVENQLGPDEVIKMEMMAPVQDDNPDYQEIKALVKAKKLKIEE